jgi:16S rRNA processing protein RimM
VTLRPHSERPAAVTLGHVSRPNGLQGAVVLHIDPSMTGVVVRGLEVELAPRSDQPRRSRVLSAAPVRGGLRVTLEGVSDRNASEALVGATVSVERDALGFGEDEFLESDLVGLEVAGADGAVIGRVAEVIATGANDIYVVRTTDGGEVLVPAVGHAVLGIDLEAGRMTVDASALEYGGPTGGGSDGGSPRGEGK